MTGTRSLFAWLIGAIFSAASAQAPPADTLAREMLGAHNAVRARVGVPPLTWSSQLEAAARQWAESLIANGKFSHRQSSNYGETLFEIRGGRASAAQVIGLWAAEEKDYDHATNTCRADAACGHYTQLVWRTTKQVGCASSMGGRREVWVCYYNPPGNWEGQPPY